MQQLPSRRRAAILVAPGYGTSGTMLRVACGLVSNKKIPASLAAGTPQHQAWQRIVQLARLATNATARASDNLALLPVTSTVSMFVTGGKGRLRTALAADEPARSGARSHVDAAAAVMEAQPMVRAAGRLMEPRIHVAKGARNVQLSLDLLLTMNLKGRSLQRLRRSANVLQVQGGAVNAVVMGTGNRIPSIDAVNAAAAVAGAHRPNAQADKMLRELSSVLAAATAAGASPSAATGSGAPAPAAATGACVVHVPAASSAASSAAPQAPAPAIISGAGAASASVPSSAAGGPAPPAAAVPLAAAAPAAADSGGDAAAAPAAPAPAVPAPAAPPAAARAAVGPQPPVAAAAVPAPAAAAPPVPLFGMSRLFKTVAADCELAPLSKVNTASAVGNLYHYLTSDAFRLEQEVGAPDSVHKEADIDVDHLAQSVPLNDLGCRKRLRDHLMALSAAAAASAAGASSVAAAAAPPVTGDDGAPASSAAPSAPHLQLGTKGRWRSLEHLKADEQSALAALLTDISRVATPGGVTRCSVNQLIAGFTCKQPTNGREIGAGRRWVTLARVDDDLPFWLLASIPESVLRKDLAKTVIDAFCACHAFNDSIHTRGAVEAMMRVRCLRRWVPSLPWPSLPSSRCASLTAAFSSSWSRTT